MKKLSLSYLVILLFLFISFNFFAQQKEQKTLVKRTILILPFFNINNVEKYNYIGDTLRDALKSELIKTDYYLFINFSDIENTIKKLKYTNEDTIKEVNAKDLAVRLKADVVVIGKFIIIEEKIMIQIEAIDIFKNQTVASTTTKGEIGLDIFRIIEESTKDMAGKMIESLKMVDKTYFDEMNNIIKKEQKLKLKSIFTPLVKTGIILNSIGGGLALIGLPILIYDLAGYSNVVQNKLYNNDRSDAGYQDYLNASYTYIGLFAGSLVAIGVGSIMLIVGIPLIVYDLKKKNRKLSFNIIVGKNLKLELCYKF